MRIYISSTFDDLEGYRYKVYHTLRQMRHDVIAMEDYVATDKRPLQKCLADIEGCDIYVGIFAWRYGYVPPEGNPKQLSITELEYRKAVELGIRRLIFLLNERTPWLLKFIDGSPQSNQDGKKITTFREELRRDNTVMFFSDPNELGAQVSVTLQQLLIHQRQLIKVDWNQRFIDYMRRYAGARSEQEALNRYLPLHLQSAQPRSQNSIGFSLPIGTFKELMKHPGTVGVVGEPGSGKTTLLLYEARQLASESLTNLNSPLPAYLSLSKFESRDANTILELAAFENGIEYQEFYDAWWNSKRRICLFLDGANETNHTMELIDAIKDLYEEGLYHSIVIAYRPGFFRDNIKSSQINLNELFLLPLSDAQIDSFLACYNASSLASALDIRLREVVQEPGILSAFAQSAHSFTMKEIPRNLGQIYKLHINHLLQLAKNDYHFEFVKCPILADLAYQMASKGQNHLQLDDLLYDRIASLLEEIYQRHHRRRRTMPFDWNAEELIEEIWLSTVVEEEIGRPGRKIKFSKQYYHDYFLAFYLASNNWDSKEIQNLVDTINSEIWVYPMMIMLGIKPETGKLLDSLPVSAQQLATRLWFETRPSGLPPPKFIQSNYLSRYGKLEKSFMGTLDSEKILESSLLLLKRSDPCKRLEVVNDLSQMGSVAADVLLDSIVDDHPLVRAAAHYALLHICEFYPQKGLDQPIPPLIQLRGKELSYTSYGGGNFDIGSLALLQFEFPADISLSVNIGELDFDPFSVECKFNFFYTPPILYAANLFKAIQNVDWLELTIRCQWIATHAEIIAQKAKDKGLLDILSQLRSRAAEYTYMGKLLADDFGIPWPLSENRTPPILISETEEAFNQLRRLYGTANLSRSLHLLKLITPQQKFPPIDNSPAEILDPPAQGIKIDMEDIVAKHITGADINRFDIKDGSAPRYIKIDVAQKLEKLEQAHLVGIKNNLLVGSLQYLPIKLLINCQIEVKDAIDASIAGLVINKHEGGVGGLRFVNQITIDHIRNTDVQCISISKNEGC